MMNDTLTTIFNRRTIRAYDDRPIDPKDLELLKEATLRAPSAGNMMYYSVIEAKDQTVKDKLAVFCDNQPMIAKAPLVWVFLADTQKWVNYFHEGGSVARGIAEGTATWRKPGLGDMHLCIQDAIIAAQTAVIAAQSLGIGSCYIGDIIERYEDVRDLLGLKQYTIPACMVIFGYPKNPGNNVELKKRSPASSIFMTDRYRDLHLEDLKTAYGPMEEEMRRHNRLPFGNTGSIADYYYFRKYSSSFMEEMNRSTKAFMQHWDGPEETLG
ncbi:MAG: nitroreductase family protein [Sphaerochaetaceae bacterium]